MHPRRVGAFMIYAVQYGRQIFKAFRGRNDITGGLCLRYVGFTLHTELKRKSGHSVLGKKTIF